MSFFVELTLGLITLILLIWWRIKTNRDKHFYDTIPGPPANLLLGNVLDFNTTTEILSTFLKYLRKYGGVTKFRLGPFNKNLLISDPKFLEFVFNSPQLLRKSDDYKFLGSWLGTGLLTGDGPKWKLHRRILTPAFHFNMLEKFIDGFESCGQILIEKLEQEVGKDSVEVHHYITLCTLDIICESTMGININAQNDDNSDYVRSVKDMCRIIIERSMSPIQMNDFLYYFTKNYSTEKKAVRILHEKTNQVITEKLKALEAKSKEDTDNEKDKKKNVFLDILLETRVDGKPLSQEEIREEVATFMFAGHDTTATAISFTLFCLANHPEIQKEAFEEQMSIFENINNPVITYSNLQEMKYLEMVIKESLRLYPPVPMYCRQTTSEAIYENKRLPNEDTLVIFPYGLHRDPKYFNDPEKFDPSRFENLQLKSPYAYIPFSAGPRNCIGQKFGMLEMKSVISKILRKFELCPAVPEHQLIFASETVLKSVNGVKIGLKLRSL